jgi:hypothetical protein
VALPGTVGSASAVVPVNGNSATTGFEPGNVAFTQGESGVVVGPAGVNNGTLVTTDVHVAEVGTNSALAPLALLLGPVLLAASRRGESED